MADAPPPMPMEWHDNIEDVEEREFVDVTTVLKGHKLFAVVETSRGKLAFQKVKLPKQTELYQRHRRTLRELAVEYGGINAILSKKEEDRTKEEADALEDFVLKGRDYTLDLVYASLTKPAMTVEQFQLFLEALGPGEREHLLNTVQGMYATPEQIDASKNIVSAMKALDIPLDKDLDGSSMTGEQALVALEVRKAEEQRARDILDAIGR